MEGEKFTAASSEMTKYIVNYLENIRERRVLPDVQPGYIRELLPEHAPETSEKFEEILKDVEKIIMPGVTHWHSPRFNAYFPAANSYPSILADMLSAAIGCIGFSWIASPACTELEMVMMDWLGELIGLPDQFLAKNGSKGGGVIQGTASEATLVALLSAKKRILAKIPEKDGLQSLLIAYASNQSHSSVERAAMLAGVEIRLLPASQDKCSLEGETLRAAIEKDIANGFLPFYVVATIGTTNSCGFDKVREIGEVCNEFGLWCHIDAAYAGSAFVCEEYRYLIDGIELVDSFNFNPHKWLLVNFDCSAMWVQNSSDVEGAFNVDPLYLKHQYQGRIPDYRIGLAKEFENYVRKDPRFEIFGEVVLGLVCFRVKGTNELNEKIIKAINGGGVIHLVPGKIQEIYFLRYAVCSRFTESSDVLISWTEVEKRATEILKQEK